MNPSMKPVPGSGPFPLFVCSVFIFGGCYWGVSRVYQKNAFINRRQLVFVSRKMEKKIGNFIANGILEDEKKKSTPKKDNKYDTKNLEFIQSLISYLISQYKPYNPDEWKINYMNSDVVNAFALPGGNIFVNSGLLKNCKSVDELAFVLAHEISHCEGRHSMEKLSIIIPIYFAVVFAIYYFVGGEFDWITNFSYKYLIELPESRFCEKEADKLSTQICKKAGFDPNNGAEFFKRGDHNLLEFLSTHPSDENRVEKIYEEAEKIGQVTINKENIKKIQDFQKNFKKLVV